MSTGGWGVVIAAVSVVLVAAGWRAWHLGRDARRRLRNRIAHEKATGHQGVRKRVRTKIGRQQDTLASVLRAETMPGWVWFYWTRRPTHAFREHMGWAPTKRLAQRQLDRAVERDRALRSSARR